MDRKMEQEFMKICRECGYEEEELGRLRAGNTVLKYRMIPTLEELTCIFSRADNQMRAAREKVFYRDRSIRLRKRIGQGIHDRAEKIIFSFGEPLSDYDISGLKKHQPHPVKFYSALNLEVPAGVCLDFSAFADDFGLPLGDDLLCSVNIGTLVLEEGASICVRGNLFSFLCQKLVKKGNGEHPDIQILPTRFSYSPGYRPFGESLDGAGGECGEDGTDGCHAHTPTISGSIFGNFHFGQERGIKNGGDGTDGTDGTPGENGLCGGASKIAEIIIRSLELQDGSCLYVKAKGGDGGCGGDGGRGGRGGNGGMGADAYDVFTPEKILHFKSGQMGRGGDGGHGGNGGCGGNAGICSNIFIEVPEEYAGKIICISQGGRGGCGGKGGDGGAGGIGVKNGKNGVRGADGRNGHDRPGPPMYVNADPFTK